MRNTNYLLIVLLISSFLNVHSQALKDSNFEFIESSLGEVYKLGTGDKKLLLIPCASCRWRSFDEFMERNKAKYTMYAVTLPGYGGTNPPDLPKWSSNALWQNHSIVSLELLLEKEKLSDVTIIGSSFGTTIGLKLASNRSDLISGIINLDGSFLSSVVREQDSEDKKQEYARRIMLSWGLPLLTDYDGWQRFNTPSIHARPDRKLLYHGWFMATDPGDMMQYWRENLLENRNEDFRNLQTQVLDIKAIRPWDETPEDTRKTTEESINEVGPPKNYQLIFLYDTPHFIMEERPSLLDSIVTKFLNNEKLEDFRPKEADADQNVLNNMHQQYIEGWKTMNKEMVMSLFEEDAIIQPNRLKPIQGKENIKAFWFPNDGSVTTIHNFNTKEIAFQTMDTLAIATYTSNLDWSYKKGETIMARDQKGVNTVIYRKQLDGSWKIWRRMWTDIHSEKK